MVKSKAKSTEKKTTKEKTSSRVVTREKTPGATPVLVVLQNHIIDAIDKQLINLPLHLNTRAGYVRTVLYETLGYELPEVNSNIPDRQDYEDQDLSELADDTRRAVELYRGGLNLSETCRQILKEGYPTRRGGVWHHHSIRNLLLEAAKKLGIVTATTEG